MGQGGVDSGSVALSFSRMSVMGKPGGMSGLVQRHVPLSGMGAMGFRVVWEQR